MSLRAPRAEDGVAVSDLVAACPPLDRNSLYCNLLQCTHWADTCVLAECCDATVGFISAYRIPARPDTIFVWQVAVASSQRGAGLAGRMLDALLQRPACNGVVHLETTVTPDNHASLRLFDGFARRRRAPLHRSLWFDAQRHFASRHESELLLRIGPFTLPRSPSIELSEERMTP